jgi:integrase/recombinase XerD
LQEPLHDFKLDLPQKDGAPMKTIAFYARLSERENSKGKLTNPWFRIKTERAGKPLRKEEIKNHPEATSYFLSISTPGCGRKTQKLGDDFNTARQAFINFGVAAQYEVRGEKAPTVLEDVPERTTIAQAVESWITQITTGRTRRKRDASVNTVTQYSNAANQFQEFAKSEGVFFLDELKDNAELFEEFAKWIPKHTERRAGGHVEGTVINKLQYITAFYVAAKLGKALPYLKEDWPKNPRDEELMPEAFTKEELSGLLAVATEDESDLLLFFINTGFRVAEVAHACYSDIKQNGSINVAAKPEWNFRVKNRKPRPDGIALTPDFLIRMKARRQRYTEGALIFPGRKGTPRSNSEVLAIFRKLAKRAGMPEAFPVASRQGCHKLRRTFATLLHSAGVSVRDIQSMLGHASPDTTLKYLATTVVPSSTMVEAFAGVGK